MMGWHWHQLHHMQIICTLLQTDNQASTSPQAGCPSCHPTNSIKALKALITQQTVKYCATTIRLQFTDTESKNNHISSGPFVLMKQQTME